MKEAITGFNALEALYGSVLPAARDKVTDAPFPSRAYGHFDCAPLQPPSLCTCVCYGMDSDRRIWMERLLEAMVADEVSLALLLATVAVLVV